MALVRAQRTVQYNPIKKFERKGDSLKGYYKGQREKKIKGFKTIVHTYLTAEGPFDIMGQSDILSQLKKNSISEGSYVEITFTGEKKKLSAKSKFASKVYDVDYDKSDRNDEPLEVAGEEDLEDAADDSHDDYVEPKPSDSNKARVDALLAKRGR